MAETAARRLRKVPRILIVEDIAPISHLLDYFLSREGYEVPSTADPSQALEPATRCVPGLVVLDVHLPGQCGSSSCPAGKRRRTWAGEVGAADAYLEKSFRMETFLGVVRRVLGLSGRAYKLLIDLKQAERGQAHNPFTIPHPSIVGQC